MLSVFFDPFLLNTYIQKLLRDESELIAISFEHSTKSAIRAADVLVYQTGGLEGELIYINAYIYKTYDLYVGIVVHLDFQKIAL